MKFEKQLLDSDLSYTRPIQSLGHQTWLSSEIGADADVLATHLDSQSTLHMSVNGACRPAFYIQTTLPMNKLLYSEGDASTSLMLGDLMSFAI